MNVYTAAGAMTQIIHALLLSEFGKDRFKKIKDIDRCNRTIKLKDGSVYKMKLEKL